MENQLQLQLHELPDGSHQLTLEAPTGAYTMNAQELSEIIAGMAENRSLMLPAVPMNAPPMANMGGVADDPPLRWAYDEMNDRAILLIRHPGYGWVGYSLPFQTVEALQLGLQQIADHRNGQRRNPN